MADNRGREGRPSVSVMYRICLYRCMIDAIQAKMNARIGNRYEHYISWLLQQDGWEVQQRGIKYGINDRGIDLIATKGSKTRFVQCKGWKIRWHIHENTVNQFLGSVAYQVGIENLSSVELYIYSPAEPTPYALAVADKFGIRFVRKSFPIWHRKRKLI